MSSLELENELWIKTLNVHKFMKSMSSRWCSSKAYYSPLGIVCENSGVAKRLHCWIRWPATPFCRRKCKQEHAGRSNQPGTRITDISQIVHKQSAVDRRLTIYSLQETRRFEDRTVERNLKPRYKWRRRLIIKKLHPNSCQCQYCVSKWPWRCYVLQDVLSTVT